MKKTNRKRTSTTRTHSSTHPTRRARKLRVVSHTAPTEPVADPASYRIADALRNVREWLMRKWLALRSLP